MFYQWDERRQNGGSMGYKQPKYSVNAASPWPTRRVYNPYIWGYDGIFPLISLWFLRVMTFRSFVPWLWKTVRLGRWFWFYCQVVLDGTGKHTKSYGKWPLMVDLPNLKMVIIIVFCMFTRG